MDTIIKQFCSLNALGKPLSASWVQIRHALKEIQQDYISLNDFLLLCQDFGINDEATARIVSQTLHNLGVLIHFQYDFGLDNLVILNHEWCLDAVFKVLNEKILQKNHGKFHQKALKEIWSREKYRDKQLELLQL